MVKYVGNQGKNESEKRVSILEKVKERIEERLKEWAEEEKDPFLLILAHGVLSSAESCEIVRLKVKERVLELIEHYIRDLEGCLKNNDIELIKECIFNISNELVERVSREL